MSTNACFSSIELILITAIFNAGNLLTKNPWRGLYPIPYFCLAGKSVSGTRFPAVSDPTRLSIHLFSNLAVGRLSATSSVINWYSLCIGLNDFKSFLYLMLSNAVSVEIIDSKLYEINLLESTNAINATPDPTGFDINAATSDADLIRSGMFEGITALFLTQ